MFGIFPVATTSSVFPQRTRCSLSRTLDLLYTIAIPPPAVLPLLDFLFLCIMARLDPLSKSSSSSFRMLPSLSQLSTIIAMCRSSSSKFVTREFILGARERAFVTMQLNGNIFFIFWNVFILLTHFIFFTLSNRQVDYIVLPCRISCPAQDRRTLVLFYRAYIYYGTGVVGDSLSLGPGGIQLFTQ